MSHTPLAIFGVITLAILGVPKAGTECKKSAHPLLPWGPYMGKIS